MPEIVARTVLVPRTDISSFPVLLAVSVVAAGRGEYVVQVFRVKDDTARNLLQLSQGERLVGVRGDVNIAAAFG